MTRPTPPRSARRRRSATVFAKLLSALALLAVAACTIGSPQPSAATAPPGSPEPGAATAPNANNPYASDPLDPNMNPHYVHPRGR